MWSQRSHYFYLCLSIFYIGEINTNIYIYIYIHTATILEGKNLDDNDQITTTFVVSSPDCFVVFQFTCKNEYNRCLPNTTFPSDFCVAFTSNYWLDLKNVNSNSISLSFHTCARKICFLFVIPTQAKFVSDLCLILQMNSGHSLSRTCLIIKMWPNFATDIIETKKTNFCRPIDKKKSLKTLKGKSTDLNGWNRPGYVEVSFTLNSSELRTNFGKTRQGNPGKICLGKWRNHLKKLLKSGYAKR